jgi:hypothetical protein
LTSTTSYHTLYIFFNKPKLNSLRRYRPFLEGISSQDDRSDILVTVEPKRFSGKSAYGAIRDLADGTFAAPNQLAASHPSRQLLGLLISIREHRIDRKRGLSDGAMIFVVSGLGEFIATKNLGDARRV